MTPLDWAAVIGAAAWVPQVGGWLARKFTRPVLTVTLNRAPEIGYTSFGPVFNLTCAISAEKKDAIVQRMTLRLDHERGHHIDLSWVILSESFSQFRGSTSQSELTGKSQVAIALKVSTLLLTEKTIGFNDLEFQARAASALTPIAERLAFLRKNQADAANQVLASKDFADVIALWDHTFPWQEGRYDGHLALWSLGSARPAVHRLAFKLRAADIERLKANLTGIRQYQEQLVKEPGKTFDYPWNWIYPVYEA
jgi:hypothetical protein